MLTRRLVSRLLGPATVAAFTFPGFSADQPKTKNAPPSASQPYVNLPPAEARALPEAHHRPKGFSRPMDKGGGTIPLPIPPRAGAALISEAEWEDMAEGVPRGQEGPGHSIDTKLPRRPADWAHFPQVPPAIGKSRGPTTVERINLTPGDKFDAWCYNGKVPGPFIRAKVGDVLEVQYTNKDAALAHNIDFHAVTGPGGGAPALFVEPEQKRSATFKLLHPGLFVYHCAAAPVPIHIANGMYGLIYVEPEEGLPPVDREYCVMQSEFYAEALPGGNPDEPAVTSYQRGLNESPTSVVFNGREGALTEKPLVCRAGETVRLFVGNAGPNLISSFHVIGTIFDKVWREGDVISPPGRSIQTTLIPAGGSAVIDIQTSVPGSFTMVDHSIFRLDLGAVGFLKVIGQDPRHDIYSASEPLAWCPGCKLHN